MILDNHCNHPEYDLQTIELLSMLLFTYLFIVIPMLLISYVIVAKVEAVFIEEICEHAITYVQLYSCLVQIQKRS